MNSVKIMKLEDLNTLVIKQEKNGNLFTTTSNSLIISIPNLSYLLKYLLFSGTLSPKLLDGVLREYYDANEE